MKDVTYKYTSYKTAFTVLRWVI